MRAKPYQLPRCVVPGKTVRTGLARTRDPQCHHMLEIPVYGTVARLVGRGDDWWPYGGERVVVLVEAEKAVETRTLVQHIDGAERNLLSRRRSPSAMSWVEDSRQWMHPPVAAR